MCEPSIIVVGVVLIHAVQFLFKDQNHTHCTTRTKTDFSKARHAAKVLHGKPYYSALWVPLQQNKDFYIRNWYQEKPSLVLGFTLTTSCPITADAMSTLVKRNDGGTIEVQESDQIRHDLAKIRLYTEDRTKKFQLTMRKRWSANDSPFDTYPFGFKREK